MSSASDSIDRVKSIIRPRNGKGITAQPWWPWVVRVAKTAFFVVVAYLIVTQARAIQWGDVFEAVRNRPLQSLWLAAIPAAASYALYSCFDLLGRHLTRHALKWHEVAGITFISYAFNLNLGSLIGAAVTRYRLYSRRGLNADAIARIIGTSIFTNWLGYLAVAGFIFLWSPLQLPPQWKIDSAGLHILGGVLLATVVIYLGLCIFFSERRLVIRGHKLTIQRLRFALLQLVMSGVNWLLIASVIYLLLEQKIAFSDVLCVFLITVVASLVVHVPAGLGVIEAVFVALLSHRMPSSELLAALLMYRAIYYLIPLAFAALGYMAIELRAGVADKAK